MRLATFELDGTERVGVIENGHVVDVSTSASSVLEVIQDGEEGLRRVRKALPGAPRIALERVRLRAPIPSPPKNILCLGLNYQWHVEEGVRAGAAVSLPDSPLWFTKMATSVCGPYDDIALDPTLSAEYDWEVELAVIIGRTGRRIHRNEALSYVHSYSVFNDLSMRDMQRRHGGQWFKSKSLDRSAPFGPWLVTADEVGDPSTLQLTCRVDGVVKQHDTASALIFDIATCIADISEVLTLDPGDVISTGTPGGVGFARVPPEFLQPGQLMESEIDRIGILRNRIVAESPRT
jgi:2-keto-4-pentenoate hydratase/2-oxohepta-3-ene-1,7-dioic acid hydratase in catechol pathway